jgi:hypothetical protein
MPIRPLQQPFYGKHSLTTSDHLHHARPKAFFRLKVGTRLKNYLSLPIGESAFVQIHYGKLDPKIFSEYVIVQCTAPSTLNRASF